MGHFPLLLRSHFPPLFRSEAFKWRKRQTAQPNNRPLKHPMMPILQEETPQAPPQVVVQPGCVLPETVETRDDSSQPTNSEDVTEIHQKKCGKM